jgi:hypothetical protein
MGGDQHTMGLTVYTGENIPMTETSRWFRNSEMHFLFFIFYFSLFDKEGQEVKTIGTCTESILT